MKASMCVGVQKQPRQFWKENLEWKREDTPDIKAHDKIIVIGSVVLAQEYKYAPNIHQNRKDSRQMKP